MQTFQKHCDLSPHHRYQLEIIFLYTVCLFLFIPYYLFLEEFQLDKSSYQWYFFFPFMIFYTVYSLNTRNKITDEEKINPRKRHIIHWVLFGLIVIFMQLQPSDLSKLQSVDLSFFVFSLFLADSYWDFKKISLFK